MDETLKTVAQIEATGASNYSDCDPETDAVDSDSLRSIFMDCLKTPKTMTMSKCEGLHHYATTLNNTTI